MVENLKCLAHKKGQLPSPAVQAPVKTEVASLEILDIPYNMKYWRRFILPISSEKNILANFILAT